MNLQRGSKGFGVMKLQQLNRIGAAVMGGDSGLYRRRQVQANMWRRGMQSL